MLRRRLASLVSLGALGLAASLLGACATGVEDDGFGGLSAAYSAGAGEGSESGDTGSGGEEGDSDSGPAPTTTSPPPSDGSSGDDGGGSPQCCEVHPTAGCGAAATESCVCTSQPACCQAVWTEDCVDLAIACGDPFCAGDPGEGSSTGEPVEPPPAEPPEPPPAEPPPAEPPPPPPADPWPTCPCLNAPGVNNFCHYGPSYPGCPMTAPGGYCDPNGDGGFAEGNWEQGWYDWQAQCA